MKKNTIYKAALALLLLAGTNSTPVLADETEQPATQTATDSVQSDQTSNPNPSQNSNQEDQSSTSSKPNDQTDQQTKAEDQHDSNRSNPNQATKPSPESGWRGQGKKTFYLINGKKAKGLKKIEQSWYLFDKHGYRLSGLRKIPHTSTYGYFDNNGKRKFSNASSAKAYYWIDSKGKVIGIKNKAKVISQLPEMPTGCEITVVIMMLNFAGVHISKTKAAAVMPRSSNPNRGFIGSPYKAYPLGYWVAPNGVKPVVKRYLGKAVNMTGYPISALKQKLLKSHLVVVWVGAFDTFSNHALTLTGYKGSTLFYNDPWTGKKASISEASFRVHWALDAYRALSY